MRNSNIYYPLWRKYLPIIEIQIKNAKSGLKTIQLSKPEFESLGKRDISDYTFNLEIKNGKVINDISGTAVARDLFDILKSNSNIKKEFTNKHYKLNLGKDYNLKIDIIYYEHHA